MPTMKVKIDVDRTELDAALHKATLLQEKMQEVKILADELNSCIFGLKLEVKL